MDHVDTNGSNRVMSYTNSLGVSPHHSESINYHLPCYPSSHTCNSLSSSLCRHNFHSTPSDYNLPPPYPHSYHSLSPPYSRWWHYPSAPACHCHRPLKEVFRNEQVSVRAWCVCVCVCVMLYTSVYLHLLGSFLFSRVGDWFDQMVLPFGEPICDFRGILFVSTEY